MENLTEIEKMIFASSWALSMSKYIVDKHTAIQEAVRAVEEYRFV